MTRRTLSLLLSIAIFAVFAVFMPGTPVSAREIKITLTTSADGNGTSSADGNGTSRADGAEGASEAYDFTISIGDPPNARATKFLAQVGTPDPAAAKIRTAQDLSNIRNNLSGSYVLANDIDLSGFGGGVWQPIGSEQSRFSGTLDGAGHTIKNLRIPASENRRHAGLFAFADGCTIKNLGIEIKELASSSCAGGLIAEFNGFVIINNCYSIGDVASVSGYSASYAGGLLGNHTEGYSNALAIKNSYSTGRIQAKSSSSSSYSGGLAGKATLARFENCYAAGGIASASSATASAAHAGGLVGGAAPTSIKNCYSTGDVTSLSYSDKSGYYYSYAGGLVGIGSMDSQAKIESSHSTGDITASSCSGGLVGYGSVSIKNSYASGDIATNANADGLHYPMAGGLVGHGKGALENCRATGDVSSASVVGGLAGYFTGSIDSCCATGDATTNNVGKGCAYAGGMVGAAGDYSLVTIMTGEYSAITIKNSYATGDVSSKSKSQHSFAGGAVGHCYSASIINSYASGNVASAATNTTSLADYASYAGGLVGRSSGGRLSVACSYCLTDQKVVGDNISKIGTPLTPSQMKTQETLDGWDFGTVWAYLDGANGGYPVLASSAKSITQ